MNLMKGNEERCNFKEALPISRHLVNRGSSDWILRLSSATYRLRFPPFDKFGLSLKLRKYT